MLLFGRIYKYRSSSRLSASGAALVGKLLGPVKCLVNVVKVVQLLKKVLCEVHEAWSISFGEVDVGFFLRSSLRGGLKTYCKMITREIGMNRPLYVYEERRGGNLEVR